MDAQHTDSRIAMRENCVARYVLERQAAEQPDKVFIAMPDGRELTFAQFRVLVLQTVAALEGLGVGQGGTVMSWLPNGLDILRVWMATNYLGAVHVPINTAYRGRLLGHVIENSGATVIVTHGDLVERLHDVDLAELKHLVTVGAAGPAPAALSVHAASIFDAQPPSAPPALERQIEPWDTMEIIYTSGTTGPSKGVLSSYFHMLSAGHETFYYLTSEDRIFSYLPFFHAASIAGFVKMLADGGSIGLVEAFDTQRFWSDVNRTQSTVTIMLGSVATFLVNAGPSDEERRTTLKVILGSPLSADGRKLAERAGLTGYACWNMTETSSPIISGPNPQKPATCGRLRAGVEGRLVDENDCEEPVGAVGELILRTEAPWAMNSGYHKEPEATARAWRNGWFHTGDAFRKEEDGEFYFVDRIKDAIRRRGENISSTEVEVEVRSHPQVGDACAVAVPSEYGEDEVMIVVQPKAGECIDPVELTEFLIPRMAHFMVPRYVRFMDELPKTPTLKVQKHLLRDEGITAGTWDREAHGIKVKREKFDAGKAAKGAGS